MIFNISGKRIRSNLKKKTKKTRIREEDIMQIHGKIILVGILVMLACTGIVNADKPVLDPGTTSFYGVEPVVASGNTVTCTSAGCSGTTTFEIEEGNDGTYDGQYCIDAEENQCITIDANKVLDSDGENSIDWSSTFDVTCIILKGNDGYDTYYCTDDHQRGDKWMSPPTNPVNQKPAAISHILVCYAPGVSVPEFPTWFMSLVGIACLAGLLVVFRHH